MSSSPSSVKQRSPKRTSARRTPLQERTSSQANEISSRLSRDALSEQEQSGLHTTTPFPTKAAHILLPSSLKKQKGGSSPIGDVIGFPFASKSGRSGDTQRNLKGGAQPTVKLKRSVKALRDLYEAQAGEASRPSTATSPPLRPNTAGSSRLRSLSSSESLYGAYAWEALRKISSDDLALLPTLPAGSRVVKRLSSRSSFTSPAGKTAATSSPNYRVLGVSSSPRPAAFKDLTSPVLPPFDEIPRTGSAENSSSSPNVIRLGHTSSTEQFHPSDQSSSPNVIKLGTSSPIAARPGAPSYLSRSRSSSGASKKRKRSGTGEGEGGSYVDRFGARNPLASSPPVDRYGSTSAVPSSIASQERIVPSSVSYSLRHTESLDESSSVIHVLGKDEPSSDGSSVADTHASLQAALSSSPLRIQYPIVRAPPASQEAGLDVPKRTSRSLSTELSGPKNSWRLSAVPSEGSWIKTRPASEASFVPDDLNEYLNSDELAPASAFIINQSANQSQIRIVRDSESDLYGRDSHEAADAVSALPSNDYTYISPPRRHARSGSYVGSPNSSQSRLNSMKSFTLSRHNSFISTSLRPSSSSSTASNIIVPVPTWAQRYYSGFYRDSFQYLYANASHSNLHHLAVAGHLHSHSAYSAPSRPEASRIAHSPTRTHAHQPRAGRLEGLRRPKRHPRIEARKSHTLPGVGPLVSNPVRGPATAAATSATRDARRQSFPNHHGRSVSAPLPPLDPRAHWAGMIEIHERPLEDGRGSSYTIHHHNLHPASYGYSISRTETQSESVIYHPNAHRNSHHRWASSPHLHHDHRLNTGSTESRGFGYPFNTKSRWTAPSIINESGRPWWTRADLRTTQVICFTAGFLLPLTWFIAAVLPLPKRPTRMQDIEKQVYMASAAAPQRQSYLQFASQSQSLHSSRSQQYLDQDQDQDQDQDREYSNQAFSELESMDIIDKLRLERQLAGVAELRWQNARWWRTLNRWMCIVGVVVCVIVIVLAAVGTQQKW
ncbi:hypothetical protein A1O1_01950 [Capronia coronata CBS 617.96]|uniref:Serine-rich protein n=1 Tax=Capronia coronata CBS 617.96 TaxID=1182541 RepID=W9YLX1_9EURO|nr:uncharacterized protein A1O1_01950 [Capronia coronata CBS 617.96]EXJ93558.1 hypothetical protein A1O1_01950 [Capronia coronata CBS 617.96]